MSVTVRLDQYETEMLAGGFGIAKQSAMTLMHKFAKVVGATRFMPISSAHIDSCLYHGQSSFDFVNTLASAHGEVSVPTTLNVGAVDTLHQRLHRGDSELIEKQRAVTEGYVALGCKPTLTCAPYQRLNRPRQGQHIAWAVPRQHLWNWNSTGLRECFCSS